MSTQSFRIGRAVQVLVALVLLIPASPFTRPARAAWNPGLLDSAKEAIQAFRDKAPDLEAFFDQAYGYAVFPRVKKGGLGVGGARGKGVVFEQGEPIGSATLTQATVGFQAGGQVYSEIIFFENEEALDRFTEGGFKLAAQAAAVAADKGVSTDAAYSDGVAIFTMTKGGLMYEASVGGQRFKFHERDLD